MKKYLYYFAIHILLTACTQQNRSEELYDFIVTTTYKNVYGISGKLLSVNICEIKERNVNNKYLLESTENIVRKYNYAQEGVCEISEISDLFPGVISVTVTGQNIDKFYSVKNSTDTLYYMLSTYLDNDKSKTVYNRHIWNYALNDSANENYELSYVYDDNGKNIKTNKYDFITKSLTETYTFYNRSYEDVIKLVPSKKNTQIVCCFEKEHGDTTITCYQVNGELTFSEKRYKDAGKTIKAKYGANSSLIEKESKYNEHGVDIVIKEVLDLSLIDSTYYMAGKEIRRVSVYSDSKTIVESKYDEKDNIIKRVEKSIFTVTKEDINEMLRMINKE